MKIVHLITSLGLGGAERQLKALVTGQENTASIHIVISLQDEGVIGQQLGNVKLYCLNLQKSLKGLWELYKILRHEKPDVLQTWLYHADLIGFFIGKLACVPRIVWNIRCSNMDLSRYSKTTTMVVRLLKFLSRFPHAIVTNSHAGRIFHEKFGYKSRRWIHIPNGIDTEVFKPNKISGQKLRKQLVIPEDALVIGMVGRVDPMKDYETFLKAMDVLSKNYQNLYCLIAGTETDTTHWPITPSRFYRLGIWEDIPSLLNTFDVMVLSSLSEGFPNVVGEAMACGVPAIVTDVGDVALLIENKGQLISPRNVDALIMALKKLIDLSIEERAKIGLQSREKILNTYSLSVMRKRYNQFYEQLI